MHIFKGIHGPYFNILTTGAFQHSVFKEKSLQM